MSKNNSKHIGNDYERECAKKLSKWLTGSDEKLICWRDTSSGTLSTVRNKKNLATAGFSGDFQCLDLEYINFFNEFHVDSKSLTKINLMMISEKNQKSNKLFQEWKKVCKDADKNNKIPMMLVKVRDDRSIPDFIIFDIRIEIDYLSKIDFEFNENMENYNCQLFLQDEFFKEINWKTLI
jgi:hypothetical protein